MRWTWKVEQEVHGVYPTWWITTKTKTVVVQESMCTVVYVRPTLVVKLEGRSEMIETEHHCNAQSWEKFTAL